MLTSHVARLQARLVLRRLRGLRRVSMRRISRPRTSRRARHAGERHGIAPLCIRVGVVARRGVFDRKEWVKVNHGGEMVGGSVVGMRRG